MKACCDLVEKIGGVEAQRGLVHIIATDPVEMVRYRAYEAAPAAGGAQAVVPALEAFPASASYKRDDVVELTDLQVAISEACTNVVRHAGVDEMKLRWRVEGDRVEVEVEDDGIFVERPPDSTRPGGFGISLMRSLMDEVVLLRGDRGHPGTRVLLVKRLPEPAAPSIRPRRGGPRTRRLHSGRPVREARSRRVPIPNLVGFAVAAGAVAVLAVLGTLAVVHSSHPRTAATGRERTSKTAAAFHVSRVAHSAVQQLK